MPETILVVDDSKENIDLLKTVLRLKEYKILSTSNGEEAIQMAKEASPDLVLMDVMMPRMDGFTACSILHSQEETQGIPVILLTAKTEPEDLKKGLEAGAVDYVKKPFVIVELLARVNTALRLKEAKDKLIEQEKKIAIMELAGAAAHELNQPLTAIICQMKLLEELLAQQHVKPGREMDIIQESVQRMSGIIRKIGTITKYKTKDYLLGDKIIDLDQASEDPEE